MPNGLSVGMLNGGILDNPPAMGEMPRIYATETNVWIYPRRVGVFWMPSPIAER